MTPSYIPNPPLGSPSPVAPISASNSGTANPKGLGTQSFWVAASAFMLTRTHELFLEVADWSEA
ncbi:hypothetical protein KC19_1G202200 [Ceratodon purpureus]|uniref:Uncharacterized protein n=1 Tax=Ceratodon purpureus TaxID=3225 RepID=A0A8T0JAP6_CERPU|nr:hypothetical protein KC19_1G202200 [Ceratodon purpureus]